MANDWNIPFCRSEFLQDFTIELGLCLGARPPFTYLRVEADRCDYEGQNMERLSLWAENPYGTGATLNLREDRLIWVSVFLRAAANCSEYGVGFYPPSGELTGRGIVEAFRDTFNVSTRLCYGESPLPILRQIWKHRGEVQVSGELPAHGTRNRKATY